MINTLKYALISVAFMSATPTIFAGPTELAVQAAMRAAVPAHSGFGEVAVKKVAVNDRARSVAVSCNEAAAYMPLTAETLSALKADILSRLGDRFQGYSVSISAEGRDLDQLLPYAAKNVKGPTEKVGFVRRHDLPAIGRGLDGSNIALWQSHGWYYEPSLNRWEFQRARIFQTVEDLYTQSYVLPYLIPMLENAGAYVMTPRERDLSSTEEIIDRDGGTHGRDAYHETGRWSNGETPGFAMPHDLLTEGVNPFRLGQYRVAKCGGHKTPTASWRISSPELAGTHAVYVSYASLPNSATDALYEIHAADGVHRVNVNQRMGGGTWVYLGSYPLDPSDAEKSTVKLIAESGDHDAVVSADAVKVGGGVINVARRTKDKDGNYMEYVSTDYPRFTGAAKYQLQWAGAPDSVYTPSGEVKDYTDDYRSRGLWVNWLAGGSSMLPGRQGLNIPVDLSFAWHTDAGTTMNDDIIGTLGIYCTAGDTLGNGSSRMASRDLTQSVMTNIVDVIRSKYEPNWTRRGMWDKSYAEARSPEVPAMLLELLSHQNFADMKYGLDPRFRFDVSRAVYRGMLEYISRRDGREYVVQPLPVNSFSITPSAAPGSYTLSWSATPDSLAPTAVPTYYQVQERIDDGAFRTVATVTEPTYTAQVSNAKIHSYRIVAGNDGGVSFPGEVLSLRHDPNGVQALIVNGFTRVGAPYWFDSGELAGFYDSYDSGVPDVLDISYIGPMKEFRREIPWMDDDASGFGDSRSDYETKVIAGNTHDFAYVHGKMLAQAGCGFVSMSQAAYQAQGAPEGTRIIDLILGKQRESKNGRGAYANEFKTFTDSLQHRLTADTQRGISLLISGSYVASDLADNPLSTKEQTKADKEWASKTLGYAWRAGQATDSGSAVTVQTNTDIERGIEVAFPQSPNAESYAVESPDALVPAGDKAATFMRYGNGLSAGTLFDAGTYRTAVIGFPLETSYLIAGPKKGINRLVREIVTYLKGR